MVIISTALIILEVKFTYELWYEVYTWANLNIYSFSNPGREGPNGTLGADPTPGNTEPVTTINWRDAMIWCNALSEKKGLTLVYYTASLSFL